MPESPANTALKLIARWARAADSDWSQWPTAPGQSKMGIYSTGYNGWGVQTQQKYVATLATLACLGKRIGFTDTDWALQRALAALRFNLASHHTGPITCTDSTKWGHTWISALGTERMMFALRLLEPHLSDADREAVYSLLCSEADWLLNDYHDRRLETRISATLWEHEHGNHPESNIWNGCLLWRASVLCPDHPHAANWQERAHAFLINGVSIPSDAQDQRIVCGRPICERHIGANFFPNYALDHHGYLNVGYMVICLSNAAFLHNDLKALGLPTPESLYHHQDDLWNVLRNMIFEDGRLIRIGGDTRIRYAYCQEYLMPAILYAADQFGDQEALALIPGQLEHIRHEAEVSGDGSFFGERLAELRRQSPLYFSRLESDRSCAAAMVATFWPHAQSAPAESDHAIPTRDILWLENEHGAVLHRCSTRVASFSWRAINLAQGLCLPPDDGDMAEWEYNLAGQVEFCNHPHQYYSQRKFHRRIHSHNIEKFEGGFITIGSIYEGVNLELSESWSGTDSARHFILFAALPDNHTVIGMQFCRMGKRRGYVSTVKGMHLSLPNDLYNSFQRRIASTTGKHILQSPPNESGFTDIEGNWVNIEDRIGAIGLYGGKSLAIHRAQHRRAGVMRSLYVEQICWPSLTGPRKYEAGEIIIDAGWMALSSVNTEETRRLASTNSIGDALVNTGLDAQDFRLVRVTAYDGNDYLLAANFGPMNAFMKIADLPPNMQSLHDLADNQILSDRLELQPETAKLFRLIPHQAS